MIKLILSNALNILYFYYNFIWNNNIWIIVVLFGNLHLKSKELEIFIKNKPYHLNYLIPKFYEIQIMNKNK